MRILVVLGLGRSLRSLKVASFGRLLRLLSWPIWNQNQPFQGLGDLIRDGIR